MNFVILFVLFFRAFTNVDPLIFELWIFLKLFRVYTGRDNIKDATRQANKRQCVPGSIYHTKKSKYGLLDFNHTNWHLRKAPIAAKA